MKPLRDDAPTVWPTTGRVRLVGESLGLVVLLAATWVVAGIALQGAGVGVVSAGRTAFAALGLLLVVAAIRSSSRIVPQYTAGQLIVLAVTGVAGYTVLSTLAIALAGPAIPSLVLALSPVVVLLLENALARTRVHPLVLTATVVAIVGAVLYVVPRIGGGTEANVAGGVLAALGAMLSISVYGLLFAHVNRGRSGTIAPRILPVFALGSVPLVVWAVIEVSVGGSIEPLSVAVLAVLGLGIYVPAYLLQHRLILTAGPSYTALLGLAVPPLVGIASVLLGLAPLPGPVQVLGIALTLVGMLVVIRMKE
ncbi:DMT family transporter [Microbacterium oxydans]|uniref:DMT family transporter n=1 Tax=Microbacterium oxydans TaxID=82380 RepID=UPI0024AD0D76|nr:DMT family transporter [Microbacterium oxydans]